MKYHSALGLLAALALSHTVLNAAESTVAIRDAWVREAPPNVQVLAGYARIENTSNQTEAIVAIGSAAFEKAEIHHSEVKDGVARMTQVKRLDLPPGQIVKLEPGGTHMMLFNPKSPLRAGQHVTLNFTLGNGKTLSLQADVRNPLKPSEPHH